MTNLRPDALPRIFSSRRLRRPSGLHGSLGFPWLWLLALLFLLSSCDAVSPRAEGSPSELFRTFTLGDHVDRDDPALVPGGRITVGSERLHDDLEGRTFHLARHTADLAVGLGREEDFHRRLHRALATAVEEQGLKVLDRWESLGTRHLSLSYGGRDLHGWLDLSGVRREGQAYRLTLVMTESELGAAGTGEARPDESPQDVPQENGAPENGATDGTAPEGTSPAAEGSLATSSAKPAGEVTVHLGARPTVSSPAVSRRAVVDPETGELVLPPRPVLELSPAMAEALRLPREEDLEVRPGSRGGWVLGLRGRTLKPLLATVGPDGRVRTTHAWEPVERQAEGSGPEDAPEAGP